MSHRWIATLLVAALLPLGAFADETNPGQKPGAKPADGKPADGKPGKKQRPEKKPKQDLRTSMTFPLARLTEKSKAKVAEKLKAASFIDEVETDVKKREVTAKLSSGASFTLTQVKKALKGSGTYVDLKRLKFKHPTRVYLGGPMSGAIFDRKMGRKRGFNSMPGQRLLRDLKALEGVKNVKWLDEQTLYLGMDREVSFARIASLIAGYGSRAKGSGVVKDVKWTAEKLSAQDIKKQQRNNKKNQGNGGSP